MKKWFYYVILSSIIIMPLAAQQETPLVRFPSPDAEGKNIAFCYQGDVWTIPVSGGDPKRITIHKGYDYKPQWSPDGKWIGFSSNRYGNDDVYKIPSTGGKPVRLTFHSSPDVLNHWGDNGELLFASIRLYCPVEWWVNQLQSVSSEGGTPVRLMNTLGHSPVRSPGGRFYAFERGNCRIEREAYKGSANRDIWVYDSQEDKYNQITTYAGNDFCPRWGDAGTLYFISSRSGRYNIFKIGFADGGAAGQPEQVTFLDKSGLTFFDLSRNGKLLTMEVMGNIYTKTPSMKRPVQLAIRLRSDYRYDPEEYKTFTGNATEYAVSPNGEYTAFVVRGEIFLKQNDKEKKLTVNLSRHPFGDYGVTWLHDNALVFVSDRDGQPDLYLVESSDPAERNLFKTLKRRIRRLTETLEHESTPVIAPNGKKIAYIRESGELVVAAIGQDGKLSDERVLLNGWATPEGIAWSPDSYWLAYSIPNLEFNDEIFIHPADDSGAPVNVSMHPRGDSNPVWSPDGSKLGFVSNRNNSDFDVWFVWLKKEDWEKTKRDWDEEEPKKAEKKKEKDKKKDKKETSAVQKVHIDFDNIHQRLVQVTRLSGDELNGVISQDGKTFYFTAGSRKPDTRDLLSVKWNGKDQKVLVSSRKDLGDLELDRTGSHLYYVQSGGSLKRIILKGGKKENQPYEAQMVVDYNQEKRQVFNDATATLGRRFYDPDFHGQDWQSLVSKYRDFILKASTPEDFRSMFNWMLGQLNASHMGFYNSSREQTQRHRMGFLGAEIEPLNRGVRVVRVVPETPADRKVSKLNPGDTILSVDGEGVGGSRNYYSLFINKAEKKVLLRVQDPGGKIREVVIRPKANIGNELYDEWVEERRRLTEKYSNGRLGYLHIEAMGWPSFERFERELMACGYRKEGIVIDVRYNGGGWTTDFLMTVLDVRQHAYTIPRGAAKNLKKEHHKFRQYYPFSERRPYGVWNRPAITLCNESSYSNAEIFSHAFKNLNLGQLVGVPTFGAVISTGGKRLMDGSFIRLPFRGWFVKATGDNMDFVPAVPHHLVENSPDYKSRGVDEQLKRAVEELLKEIETQP